MTRPRHRWPSREARRGRDSEPSRVVGPFVNGIPNMGAARSGRLWSITARSGTSCLAGVPVVHSETLAAAW